jgi:hypothetical protein
MDQGVTVGEVFVGEAEFLVTEKQSNFAFAAMALDNFGGVDEDEERLLWNAVTNRSGADDKSAIGDGLGDCGELFGRGEYWSASDGGAGLAEGGLVGLDNTQAEEAEVAHGASGGADV